MATHWKQNFDYKYAGAYELAPGETRTLTIARVCKENVANVKGEKEPCLVAYFVEHNKPMVLNKTNCKTIEKLYSPFIEEWSGKRIIIESRKVSAFGDEVDALRIKKTVPQSEKPIDYSAQKQALEACKTLDELKNVYMSFSPAVQAETLHVKEELKAKLSAPQGVAA